MIIKFIESNGELIGVVEEPEVVFRNVQDMLDAMADCRFNDAGIIFIAEHNLVPEFFDLSTGIAGEILQKISNYRMKLGIVGDFDKYESKSLKSFIVECNRSGRIVFASSQYGAMKLLFADSGKYF